MKSLLGLYNLDSNAKDRADVDNNGRVELIDNVYIQKWILGSITKFPAE